MLPATARLHCRKRDFFIEIGKPKSNIPKISRVAPGVGGNFGGNIEIVVPVNGVKLESFVQSESHEVDSDPI